MPRPRRKYLIPAAIVGFWLVMMALLLEREVFVQYALPGGKPAAEFDTWMGIYPSADAGADDRIGFIHSVSAIETREGLQGSRLSLTAELRTTMFEIPTEIVVTGSAWNPHEQGLAEFDFSIRSFQHTMRVIGTAGDGRLALEIRTAGERFPLEFPMGEDLLLSGSMGTTTMNLPALEVGDVVYIDSFDPLTLSKGRAKVACVGKERLEAAGQEVQTRVVTASLGGVTSKYWITEDEEVVRVETPFGFTFRKITQEEAMRTVSGASAQKLVYALAVRPIGKTAFRGARRMAIRLTELPPGVEPPSDDLQRRTGDGLYTIEMPEAPSAAVPGADLADLEAFLAGDPFVPVDHPKIVDQVNALLDDPADPWDAAMQIYRWVYENIEKTVVLSFPSALDVLESRQGDCNEHTVLFAALARTADIPTRIAIGVVWSEALGSFYYHAWPEVYVGRWVGMDPTLGQPIADATHLKLLVGNVEKWPQLAPYLGKLQIEILEIE